MPAPALILLSSRQPGNPALGTGFVFHHDDDGMLLLTCAHLLRELGGPDQILAATLPATLVAQGEEHGLDLAVLRVAGLGDRAVLALRAGDGPGRPVRISGYDQQAAFRALESVDGVLGQTFMLSDTGQRDFAPGWYVQLNSPDRPAGGLRGAPLCDALSGAVFGVMIGRVGEPQGRAISIEALPLVWPQLPAGLIGPALDPLPAPVAPAADPPRRRAPSGLIDFGSGNTIGDITIGDIAGRDIRRYEFGAAQGERPQPQPEPPSPAVDLYLAAHSDLGGVAGGRPGEQVIDWAGDFRAGDPPPEVWEQLLRDLQRTRGQLLRDGKSLIRLRASAGSSAALAFGTVLSQRAGFQINYTDGAGALWRSDLPTTASSPLLRADTPIDSSGRDLVLQLALTTAARHVTDPVDAWIRRQARPAAPTAQAPLDLAAFRQLLSTLFSDSELRELCFDLRIDYENLAGQSKADKARELIAYVERRGQTAVLLERCQILRPNAEWPGSGQPAPADQAGAPGLQRRILLAPEGEPPRLSPARGAAIARQVCDLIGYEVRPGGTVHLFGALPTGLALLIGWGLPAARTVQLYTLDQRGEYRPSVALA